MIDALLQQSDIIGGLLISHLIGHWIAYGILAERRGKEYAKRAIARLAPISFLVMLACVVLDASELGGHLLSIAIPISLTMLSVYYFRLAFTWRKRLAELGEVLVRLDSEKENKTPLGKWIFAAIFSILLVVILSATFTPQGRASTPWEKLVHYSQGISAILYFASLYCTSQARNQSSSYICDRGIFRELNAMRWNHISSYKFQRSEKYLLNLELKKSNAKPDFFSLIIDPPYLHRDIESALQKVGIPEKTSE